MTANLLNSSASIGWLMMPMLISALVDQSLAAEQHPPGVDPDHRVELVGEHEEEQQRQLPPGPP